MSPKVLKDEAFEVILSNNRLMADLATVMDVNLFSMPVMIQRKSKKFIELPSLTLIAKEMNCTPEELLVDTDKVTA